jgi:hypothetical protein
MQLYRENQIFKYHVDLTTLADGTYKLIPEPDEGISEAQVNVTKGLFEAPKPRFGSY